MKTNRLSTVDLGKHTTTLLAYHHARSLQEQAEARKALSLLLKDAESRGMTRGFYTLLALVIGAFIMVTYLLPMSGC